MAAKDKPRTDYKSADTGRYVTKKEADAKPKETYKETHKKGK